VRAEQAAGNEPRIDLVRGALERLTRSESREHAAYAVRQLALLDRLGRG
jgi:hypothetical protein